MSLKGGCIEVVVVSSAEQSEEVGSGQEVVGFSLVGVAFWHFWEMVETSVAVEASWGQLLPARPTGQ